MPLDPITALMQGALPQDTSWDYSPFDQYSPVPHPPRRTMADNLAARKLAVQLNAAEEARQRRMRLSARRSGVDPRMAYMMNMLLGGGGGGMGGGQGGQGGMNPLAAQMMFGSEGGDLAQKMQAQQGQNAYQQGMVNAQNEQNRNTAQHNLMQMMLGKRNADVAEGHWKQEWDVRAQQAKETVLLDWIKAKQAAKKALTDKGMPEAQADRLAEQQLPAPPPGFVRPTETPEEKMAAALQVPTLKPEEAERLILKGLPLVGTNPTVAADQLRAAGVTAEHVKKYLTTVDPNRFGTFQKWWGQGYWPELGPERWFPGGRREPMEETGPRQANVTAAQAVLQALMGQR